MRALKCAFVITGFLVRFDPCKPHKSAAFRAPAIADQTSWWEINFWSQHTRPLVKRQASSLFEILAGAHCFATARELFVIGRATFRGCVALNADSL
jgi:hypothetical protein